MSESAQIRVARAFLASIDNNDVEFLDKYTTDDFVYDLEPKPLSLGFPSALNKAQTKEFGEKIRQTHHGIKVIVLFYHFIKHLLTFSVSRPSLKALMRFLAKSS